MIKIKIPAGQELTLEHLVLDYNGTLAVDGHLKPHVREKLNFLAQDLTIHIITADTFGICAAECEGIPCTLQLLDNSCPGGPQKENFIQTLGPSKVVAVGNGANDRQMLASAALGIAVLGDEGTCAKCLIDADVMVRNILDALDLLIHPKRLVATLRQ
ncbi:HAD family hydrolase [Candidatus Formimonas warabiya]|uniref:ATPase P n=1 Tax=Formimonas warabiya TaxID=1761012 RepID=A0A3G1L0Z5_FORW1|nr:HAD family hydrolase [Candidatus Formimonas warabiya]ATW28155.1 ATPase P [Candidatus Formimonas warabiya]